MGSLINVNIYFKPAAISASPSDLGGSTAKAGPLAEREGDVISQSRASSLVKGFENSAPAWLAQAPPCAIARMFRFSSVSAFPPFSLCPYFRL